MVRHMPKYRKGVLTPGICTLFLSSVLLSMLSRRRRFHPCTTPLKHSQHMTVTIFGRRFVLAALKPDHPSL